MRSSIENWKEIRQQVLVNGLSQRADCEKYKLGRHKLKKILTHAGRRDTGGRKLGLGGYW